MKITITYWTIVKSQKLCDELWINEYCVNEWRVDKDDTLTIEITEKNKWILQELYNLVYNQA